jgi:hypothetical protein
VIEGQAFLADPPLGWGVIGFLFCRAKHQQFIFAYSTTVSHKPAVALRANAGFGADLTP